MGQATKTLKLTNKLIAELDNQGIVILRYQDISLPMAIVEMEAIIHWHNSLTQGAKR